LEVLNLTLPTQSMPSATLPSAMFYSVVMPGLVPGIHENRQAGAGGAWMAGPSPAMTGKCS